MGEVTRTATAPEAHGETGPAQAGPHRSAGALLALGALGIVFGDIGTSPLYALKEVFGGAHHLKPEPAAIYGVLSLVFWSVTIIVSLKYVTLIMRADNDGEGGIIALISLLRPVRLSAGRRAKWLLIALGAFGASLFYGDGMITPAISVLSAVEGLELAAPGLHEFVVPITLLILSTLFAIQRFGTGAVGRMFGPVMLVWFTTLGLLGLGQVVADPTVLRALLPHYAVLFFVDHGGEAFLALGSVVLAVTGAEALYADMGHFGRSPIRRAWFLLVFPALMLCYLGQGALVLGDPKAIDSPFFRLGPAWALIPLVVLATVATIIASQAVISGAFSVTRQAVQIGLLPLLTIRHTSQEERGQIYVPVVNWGLFAAIVALVLGFQSSTHLASAYGIAVTGTLAIDTVLFFVVVRTLWGRPKWLAVGGALAFLVVDLAFFGANLTKVVHGGWFPLAIGLVIFTILMTWRRGGRTVLERRREEEGDLRAFVCGLRELPEEERPVRVPGTAVFLNANETNTPLALRYNVEHNRCLHEHVVVLTTETLEVPHVAEADRLELDDLVIPDDGISLLTVRFGFQDATDVPAALRLACEQGLLPPDVDIDDASYFLSRVTIDPEKGPPMRMWRKRLFALMARNAASRARFLNLPDDKVIAIGSTIEL